MFKVTFIMDSLKRLEMKFDLDLKELEAVLCKAYERGYFLAPKIVREGESQSRYFIPMSKVEMIKIEEAEVSSSESQ